MSHYDRDADIASLELESFEGPNAYGEEHEWGLILRDRKTRNVVALEVWHASERLPREFLAALPKPDAKGVTIEPQPA
jgi:uncharacterized protein YuzE